MSDLATLVVSLEAETSKYTAGLSAATKQIQSFTETVTDAVKDLASEFAALFAVDKIEEFVQGTIESAASLNRLSQEVGVSTEALSGLGLAAAAAGVDQDGLSNTLKHLGASISSAFGDPTSKAAIAFAALGVSVKNTDGSMKGVQQTLNDLATAYQHGADGPDKIAAGIDILGKQAQLLTPILNGGTQGLADFQAQADATGVTLSKDLAEQAEKVETQFISLKASFQGGFGTEVLEATLPTLSAFATGMADIAKQGAGVGAVLDTLNNVILKPLGVIILRIEEAFKDLGIAFDLVKGTAVAAGKGISDAFSAFTKFDPQGMLKALTDAGKQIGDVFEDQGDTFVAIWKKTNAAITGVVTAGGTQTLDLTKQIAQGMKDALAELNKGSGLSIDSIVSPELLKQVEDGKKKLDDFAASLKTQAGSFNLGAVAQTNFKLSTGDMAKAIATAQGTLDGIAKGTINYNLVLSDSAKATLTFAAAARASSQALQTKIDTKEIDDYANKLDEQVLKLNAGDAAATAFAVSTGKLGDSITRTGAAGQAAKLHIEDFNAALTVDKDQKSIFTVDQQILTLGEHLSQASDEAFKFNNALLIKNVASTGSSATQDQLDALQKLGVSRQAYNVAIQGTMNLVDAEANAEVAIDTKVRLGTETQEQAEKDLAALRTANNAALGPQLAVISVYQKQQLDNIHGLTQATTDFQQLQDQLTRTRTQEEQAESDIRANALKNGTDEITVESQLSDVRKQAAIDLQNIVNGMNAISSANAVALPGLVDKTKQAQTAVNSLAASTNAFAVKLKTDFINDFSQSFTAFVTGTESASQAWKSFVGDVLSELIKLQTSKLLESLLSNSANSGGFFSGLAGALGIGGATGGGAASTAGYTGSTDFTGIDPEIFGGGLASGGPAYAGMSYTVGEHGAEEFVPNVDGQIVPNSKMSRGGTNVYITQNITAPGGQVSRQTNAQVAASAGAGISRATRRAN